MQRIRFDLKKAKEQFGTALEHVDRTGGLNALESRRFREQETMSIVNTNMKPETSTCEGAEETAVRSSASCIPSVRKASDGPVSALLDRKVAPNVTALPHTLQLWSDGSVVRNQYGGAAIVCLDESGEWTAQQLPLGVQSDVLTMEMIAAQAALEYAEGVVGDSEAPPVRHVIFHTDCTAVKKVVLCQHEVSHDLDVLARRSAAEAIIAAKARLLFRDVSVDVGKVRAHAGVPANESADVLAVGAARQSYVEASPNGFVAGKRARKGALQVTHGQFAGDISWTYAIDA
ncbi:hypothetical protein LTR95_010120 [Oleoguttula sp. CCFEE 5521]